MMVSVAVRTTVSSDLPNVVLTGWRHGGSSFERWTVLAASGRFRQNDSFRIISGSIRVK